MTRQRDNENSLAKSMEYDSHNRIRKVTDPDKSKKNDIGEYWYDDGGFRVRKIAKTRIKNKDTKVEVLYPSMYFGMERQLKDNGNVINNTTYPVNNIYMNGVRIAALMENGKTRYYLTDQVDSVKVVVDDDGNAVTRMEYLPYGETWPLLAIRGIAALGHPVRRFQENKTGTEEEHNPKYNSQELDKETGYYYYNARHYDPEVARFVTADTVIPRENDTQSWNRFSYCSNNPIAYKDPSGHDEFGNNEYEALGNANQKVDAQANQKKDEVTKINKDESTKTNVEGNLLKAKGNGDRVSGGSSGKVPDNVFKNITGGETEAYNRFERSQSMKELANIINTPKEKKRMGEKEFDNKFKQAAYDIIKEVKEDIQKGKEFKKEHPQAYENIKNVAKTVVDVGKDVVKGKQPDIPDTKIYLLKDERVNWTSP